MLEIIKGLPENILGFTAIGDVTAEDYERFLIPLVEEKLKKFDKLNLLYHLGDKFDSFSAHAMWDDAKVGLSHLGSWNKIAVVSDVSWIRGSAKIFGFMMPCHVKVFHDNQLDKAKAWLKE
ncbi:STAS/SEC14 domain-containing protein [Lentisphaerota bacterium ZTH]|nr:STAS/SEC14 domain-containing protein [Lentisphaerota bacterium]WET06817.1 STAS/SEC14 domain-containing protein [Lentisphaerota bacterium ZTH]